MFAFVQYPWGRALLDERSSWFEIPRHYHHPSNTLADLVLIYHVHFVVPIINTFKMLHDILAQKSNLFLSFRQAELSLINLLKISVTQSNESIVNDIDFRVSFFVLIVNQNVFQSKWASRLDVILFNLINKACIKISVASDKQLCFDQWESLVWDKYRMSIMSLVKLGHA